MVKPIIDPPDNPPRPRPAARPLRPFTSRCGRWHAWQGTAHILLSDEDCKSLTEHRTIDDVVNFLWRSAAQAAAREFHQHAKDPS